MQRPFVPLVSNPHLLTILGNFWPRHIDEAQFPSRQHIYEPEAATRVAVYEHQPKHAAQGQIVFLHGLEGSAHAGYIQSLAQAALERGFGVHRKNLRTCGGTEDLCQTMYHSGLTSDTRFVLERIRSRNLGPVFLVGFSLGGNVALKLAGELGQTDLLAGVCAISTPIELATCVRTLDRPTNRIYAQRFLSRLRDRVRRKSRISPGLYSTEGLKQVHDIWSFDDRFTAPLFGFGTAENYYATQSSAQFLHQIRIPALVIASQDDPLVPFSMYRSQPAFKNNPVLELVAPEHGGHLGFLSKAKPRFWIDEICLDWITTRATALTAALPEPLHMPGDPGRVSSRF